MTSEVTESLNEMDALMGEILSDLTDPNQIDAADALEKERACQTLSHLFDSIKSTKSVTQEESKLAMDLAGKISQVENIQSGVSEGLQGAIADVLKVREALIDLSKRLGDNVESKDDSGSGASA